ncbi:NEL-type E3 ubiquitin ligase domain-containing protein [Noviherbaspirillum pedocola]|uniref:Novel E3 ligase domain-containing protein n=1 Tax=Noviherbaspirillum pedocola TaxID=2801341 RepID=A0A934W733_9BURK|nr:hypothetical protein [Noviherbaspirillum pedocola]MBK4736932.1 hypothetical protein [Noviherbaspirillum pedocola]
MQSANSASSAASAFAHNANYQANRPDTPMLQPNLADYLARLNQWAAGEQNGTHAAGIINNWLERNDTDAVLDLSGLGLRTLPPLPDALKKLKADKNKLSFIAENHLPVGLESLDVHMNQLTSLPDTLPIANLRLLNAAYNQIDELSGAALNLRRECKVYLKGNLIEENVLTGQFGPEQNTNGLRQYSTAFQAQQPQGAPAQAIRKKMLADALPAAEMPKGFSIEQLVANLPDIGSFCVLLTQVRATPCYKDPAFRQTLAQLIVQIASDSELGAKACEFSRQLDQLDHYQVATVFHKIRLHATDRQILSGKYDGNAAEIVLHLRRKFRFDRLMHHTSFHLAPEVRQKSAYLNQASGRVAAITNEVGDLGFDMADVKYWNGIDYPDRYAIVSIDYLVKKNEETDFASYLCEHDSLAAQILKHVDPQILAIMDKSTDAMGNPVASDALTAMHERDLKEYFTRTGQPDFTLPLWDLSKQPFDLNVTYGSGTVKIDIAMRNGGCEMQ